MGFLKVYTTCLLTWTINITSFIGFFVMSLFLLQIGWSHSNLNLINITIFKILLRSLRYRSHSIILHWKLFIVWPLLTPSASPLPCPIRLCIQVKQHLFWLFHYAILLQVCLDIFSSNSEFDQILSFFQKPSGKPPSRLRVHIWHLFYMV